MISAATFYLVTVGMDFYAPNAVFISTLFSVLAMITDVGIIYRLFKK